MPISLTNLITDLGVLRTGLLTLALLNTLIPGISGLFIAADGSVSSWDTVIGIIAPVLAPLFVVVIFFDYVMCRVRAADAEGEVKRRFRRVGRIELAVIALTLVYWIPFIASLG